MKDDTATELALSQIPVKKHISSAEYWASLSEL